MYYKVLNVIEDLKTQIAILFHILWVSFLLDSLHIILEKKENDMDWANIPCECAKMCGQYTYPLMIYPAKTYFYYLFIFFSSLLLIDIDWKWVFCKCQFSVENLETNPLLWFLVIFLLAGRTDLLPQRIILLGRSPYYY